MLSFDASLDLILDDREYTKTLDRVLGQIFREGIRAWLRELLLHVPVETGMAKAALQPLGRILRIAVPITPVRKPYYSKLEGVMQSVATGAALSLYEINDDKSHPGRYIYTFAYLVDIWHYWHRQYYRGNSLPGEDALKRANDAFYEAVFSRVAHRLPSLGPYLRWSST